MRLFTASSNEFIRVIKKDGTTKFMYGPCCIFEDPLLHKVIEVESGKTIDANEAIVVFQEGTDNKVKRKVIYGPAFYMPTEKEVE